MKRTAMVFACLLWAQTASAEPFTLLMPKTVSVNTAWHGFGLPLRPEPVLIAGSEPINFPVDRYSFVRSTKHHYTYELSDPVVDNPNNPSYDFLFNLGILALPNSGPLLPHDVFMSPFQYDTYGSLLEPGDTVRIYDPNVPDAVRFGVHTEAWWVPNYVGTITVNGEFQLRDDHHRASYTMVFNFFFDPNGPMGNDPNTGAFDMITVNEVQRVETVHVPEPLGLVIFGVALYAVRRRGGYGSRARRGREAKPALVKR